MANDSNTATAPTQPDPEEVILNAVQQTVSNLDKQVTGPDRSADELLDSLLSGVAMPQETAELKKQMKRISNKIKPFDSGRKLSIATAESLHKKAEVAASSDLSTAQSDWHLAVTTYESQRDTLMADLHESVQTAIATYNVASTDAPSRQLFLYFTLKSAAAAALIEYQTAMTTSVATLAGAAGTYVEALMNYRSVAEVAEATQLNSIAEAEQTFWQEVEAALDEPAT